ncbi:MAG: ATP:cob(I)alamin adenosyltransferase [Rickettsiales bacterium]|nr:ATP:cob(I)alamin adenosyltransferase [Rickettsiales bacterium]OUV81678.1 MAG: ATP:cob(I)alamin adenosyltransferase [Rickettsiales bacterium TMED131]|tara:strand:- start:3502 stop:4050 length:549 start_codon:yes stop_codon:yes gene_type:complete
MVKLDKIYTRGGDTGYTSIVGGKRIKKSSIVIETIGSVDELNANLGTVISYLKSDQKKVLENIQNDLFDLGADLATPLSIKKNVVRVRKKQTLFLEKEIDKINSKLKPLTSFILPGGDRVSSYLHLARTVNRRCEINIIKLNEKKRINVEILKYINRLSDYLFVLARQTNRSEVLWKPLKNM